MTNLERLQQDYFAEIKYCSNRTFGAIAKGFLLPHLAFIGMLFYFRLPLYQIFYDDLMALLAGKPFKTYLFAFLMNNISFEFLLSFILLGLFFSWFINFGIYLSRNYLIQNKVNFKLFITKSFNVKVFKTFVVVAFFAIGFLLFVLLLYAFLLAIANPLFSFIGVLIFLISPIIFYVKTSIVYPLVVLKDESIYDSVFLSLKLTSLKKILPLPYLSILLVAIIITIVISSAFILLLSVALMALEASLIGLVFNGVLLMYLFLLLFQWGLLSYIFSVIFHTSIALYVQYFTKNEDEQLNLEDNILIDELN